MAGSWKRTITTPFRKACTILSPQHPSGGEDKHASTKAERRRRHAAQMKESLALAAAAEEAEMEYGGGGEGAETTSTQLYGDVMACAYEDVQVMWSMLDNKARVVVDATS